MAEIDEIGQNDLPDIEKLRQMFGDITDRIIEQSAQQIELLRAMNDREALVKEQIKFNTVKTVRGVFGHCYLRITHRKAWDE
jgi:hypothetical protein